MLLLACFNRLPLRSPVFVGFAAFPSLPGRLRFMRPAAAHPTALILFVIAAQLFPRGAPLPSLSRVQTCHECTRHPGRKTLGPRALPSRRAAPQGPKVSCVIIEYSAHVERSPEASTPGRSGRTSVCGVLLLCAGVVWPVWCHCSRCGTSLTVLIFRLRGRGPQILLACRTARERACEPSPGSLENGAQK